MPPLSWWGTVLGIFAAVLLALRWLNQSYPDALKRKSLTGFDGLVLALAAFFVGVIPTFTWLSDEDVVTANFHRQYHDVWLAGGRANASWLGVPLLKTPLDLWIYQEIVIETTPDLIIETGTWLGGTSLYFASLFDLLETSGRIVTVDTTKQRMPEHERITYLVGSSTSDDIVTEIRAHVRTEDEVMVVLDSDHSKAHVLNELRLYADIVTVGNYLVVEDTHLSGHPVAYSEGDPWAAVQQFLHDDHRFEQDHSREKYGLTFNPGGWLRRIH
jgi:cephalosporin hydroxylase